VKRFSLADIKTGGTGRPNAYLFYAVEGFGKTSLAAKTRKPIFIQSRGETGLETLIQSGLLPETPSFPEAQSWSDINDAVDTLLTETHSYRTLVIDTLNGAERLCFEHVCVRDFGGDWGERGFASYGKGPQVAVAEWLMFLQKLDKLRTVKGMTIFALSHAKVTTFKNPEGADYDRYQADMDKNTYGVTSKWADAILFGNFQVVVNTRKTSDGKGKAVDKTRVMFTERGPAFDAKNRMGMPETIEMGNSPDEAWANFIAALPAARNAATQNATATEGAENA
jgi:hypothetical protein